MNVCTYPGCDQPKKESKGTGRQSGFCVAHAREYSRRHYAGDWEGWQAPRRKKGAVPRPTKRSQRAADAPGPKPVPEPIPTPPIRILALRCDTCAVKLPYTDDHFDVTGQARTCRRCAGARVVTIVNPLDNTACRARMIISNVAMSCGEGAEAYAAFARAEKAAGHQVVIEW